MIKNKKLNFIISLAIITLSLLFIFTAQQQQIKNIIILIPDGLSVSNVTMTRWYKNGEEMVWDKYTRGLVKTHNSDSPIADSAPAATAYATGFKSHTGYISVLPDVANMPGQSAINPKNAKAPLFTILEAAKLLGKSTGLIATSNLQHATPAGFSAHFPNRNDYENIGEQQVYQNIDVMLGGGYKYLKAENRKDKEDLIEVLKNRGYQIVTNAEELKKSSSNKLYGFFADDALSYDIDRNPEKEPSLSEMTEKAISILSKNPNGFFLMVEGSKIDWANHANDPIGVISDILAFEEAVKVALNFAIKSKNTVVIVVSDHSTGGFSIGNIDTNSNYDKKQLMDFVLPLKLARLSGEGVEKLINPDFQPDQIKQIIAEYYGIKDLKDEELKLITDYFFAVKADPKKGGRFNYIIGPMLSKRAFIGWTSNGHVGEDVSFAVYHPQDITPKGVIDNTDIALYMAKIFGVNLTSLTSRYFIEATSAFKSKSATVTLDNTTDPANPVLKVTKGNIEIIIPAQKDFVFVNGKQVSNKIINVYNGSTFYVSQDVLGLIK